MWPITASPPPAGSLLQHSLRPGAYSDCYATDIAGTVTHADYVEAFYTTAIFGVERWLLRQLVSRPSTDDEARRLGAGTLDRYAAWRVEARGADQILLADETGRTWSWLMTAPAEGACTRLYFGSAVVPRRDPATGGAGTFSWAFHALLGFHKVYSRVLLYAAKSRLEARRGSRPAPE